MKINSTLTKITVLPAEMQSKIIWGVYEKFRTRNPNQVRANWGEKGDSNLNIIADIFIYLIENYSASTEKNNHVPKDIIKCIAESKKAEYGEFPIDDHNSEITKKARELIISFKSENISDTIASNNLNERVGKFVEISNFQKFMSDLLLVYQCINTPIPIKKFPIIQLEALCLYGWDKTYHQLLISDEFYLREDKIRFIPIDLRSVFEKSLRNILSSFKTADSKGGSKKIMKRACEMFTKETERLCNDFSLGRYPAKEFLKELKLLMEICDKGFGISIPKFNSHWKEKEGEDILKMNKRQAEGITDEEGVNRKSNWIRIFLVEGQKTNPFKLTQEEEKMIKKQLDYNVHVFIIFKGAWKDIPQTQLDLCDFAIIRIDDCPTLMGTHFEGSEAEGFFYTDESMPESYYSKHMSKILEDHNCKYIFEPELSRGNVVLGKALNQTGIVGLKSMLEKIYKRSK
jgi:hypothetical protein